MKSILISIKPKWCELIASGEKTIEVRKTCPKIETPFKVYIYCTKHGRPLVYGSPFPSYVEEMITQTYGYSKEKAERIFGNLQGKVIGEFVCDRITPITRRGIDNNFDYCYESLNVFGNDDIEIEIRSIKASCIKRDELNKYASRSHWLYCWHISNLVIYDEPRELREFTIVDKDAVKKCTWRSRTWQAEDIAKHGGWLKGSWTCDIDGETNWCINCKTKPLNRPPQSWCYVEELI